ncbi:hypothetical protein TAL182_CH01130 [Rhizobium sp. TAL182]|uniref:hypothetical protein n=1 Tax=Rhizobium sp. TAL182 TaxID=2020313 RepID=UPI000A210FB7|nr:hypothetical protein [Rhizobium sp. TAL182]ARO22943.1 hypothetical protein TAL182_CH01130 [Rhizobium sp. TAL182]
MSEDTYIPARKGERIPMPGNQPDWPADGRMVNFASPYEARLVADGTLKLKPASADPEQKPTARRTK